MESTGKFMFLCLSDLVDLWWFFVCSETYSSSLDDWGASCIL